MPQKHNDHRFQLSEWGSAIPRDPQPIARVIGLVFLMSLVAGIRGAGAAPVEPVGSDFQVNELTTGYQYRPFPAVRSDGRFVVTWWSQISHGDDISENSVQARLFDSEGLPTTQDFQVNTYTTGFQNTSKVDIDETGRFVVVWQSSGSSGDDSSLNSIQGRRFGAGGGAIGNDFQVNSYTTNQQLYPGLARAPNGDFVVVWQAEGILDIHGRRFGGDGTPAGPDFEVNTFVDSSQRFPAVTIAPTGRFVVAWQSFGSADGDTDNYSVHARLYAADGTPEDDQFQLNTYTTEDQLSVEIASAPDGSFVAVWASGSYSTDLDIRGRRFDASATPLGPDFQLNTYTTGLQTRPQIAFHDDGGFVVVWQSQGSPGSDVSGASIVGREFTPGGAPVDEDFQINTYTTNDQGYPQLAFSKGGDVGRFVVVWHSLGSAGDDNSLWSVQGRVLLDSGIFSDGFESGDTSAWN